MGCRHDCEKKISFPRAIFNRPALGTIEYRIGSYSHMREHMLDLLNKSATLSAWTHRGADDPGIALLESAAVVGDILTFYQNLYANEAFLRTAAWRESITELVQLPGYLLAPGVGGEATFAVKIKGEKMVTVPRGFGFKAKLDGLDAISEFESTRETFAWPHLSEFNLYCPPDGASSISAGRNQLELLAVDGAADLESKTRLKIKKGDRIILVPDSTMFDHTGESYIPQEKAELLIVSDVKTVLDRIIVTFEGSLTVNRGNTISAYIIDRTFKHFGHNAATRLYEYDGLDVIETDTEPVRWINDIPPAASDYYPNLTSFEMPLDQEVGDLALGGRLICQGFGELYDTTVNASKTDVAFTVVKDIAEVRVDTLQWANIEASTTVVTLKDRLMTNNNIFYEKMDIRRSLFHEAVSPELTFAAQSKWSNGPFTNGNLQYFGTYGEVQTLAERELLLVGVGNEVVQAVRVNDTKADFENEFVAGNRDKTNKWLWNITLDQEPQFDRGDFSQVQPVITVYGNPVAAKQGTTQSEVILGSGDNRQTFQTFAIPKTPLTYLFDETQTPAQVPELKIYVEGLLWQRVDTFFNNGPDDQVYVVREDKESKSWVQFGDGKNGSRLPSGKNNVTAIYRVGTGATGLLETGARPSAMGKLKDLEKVFLPGPVVGGDEAEDEENGRQAAPGKLQSLGRLVGLADFEAEALALPGVIKVRADWSAPGGVPLIRIVALFANGTSAPLEKVRATMQGYNRCRGPARFPIIVLQGVLQYVYLNIRVGYEARRKKADMETSVKKALGIIGEEGNGVDNRKGLFGIMARKFGQGAHVSQIIGTVQHVDGITWVEVDDAQALNPSDPVETDPLEIAKPSSPSTGKLIGCLETRILTLHTCHFDLGLTMDETARECRG